MLRTPASACCRREGSLTWCATSDQVDGRRALSKMHRVAVPWHADGLWQQPAMVNWQNHLERLKRWSRNF